MFGGRYRLVATVCFAVSALLQIVSIVSPGWVIDIQGNTENYISVFYKTICKTENFKPDCLAKAYHALYRETKGLLDFTKAGPVSYVKLDKNLHDDAQEMLFLLVALFCTIAAFIAQMVRTRIRDEYYRIATVVSPVVIALAVGLMLSIFCRKVIYNCYLTQVRSIDERVDNTYAGFPYSLAIYAVALLANILAVIFNTYQNTGSINKLRLMRRDDD